MDKTLLYNEQLITLKHPEQKLPAESAVSMDMHFAVFFAQGVILIFNKADFTILKHIRLEATLFRPTPVSSSLIAGLSIRHRRLISLDILTGEVKHLCSVPSEVSRDEKHQWYYFCQIAVFKKSGLFMLRQEAEISVCLKFFSVQRELASMKFKKQSMKANKQVIDMFDDESRVSIYCSQIKRGVAKFQIFNSVDGSIKEIKIANQNLVELAHIQKVRQFKENELLLCLTQSVQKKSNNHIFVIIENSSQQILWLYHHPAAKLLRLIDLDNHNHQIIMEQISPDQKRFQICYLNFSTLQTIAAPLLHVDLQIELNKKYLYRFLSSSMGKTKLVLCNRYRKKSLYLNLLEKTNVAKIYGHRLIQEVFQLLN